MMLNFLQSTVYFVNLCRQIFLSFYGSVAQLVEQLPLKQLVPGSSPGWPTTKIYFANLAIAVKLLAIFF